MSKLYTHEKEQLLNDINRIANALEKNNEIQEQMRKDKKEFREKICKQDREMQEATLGLLINGLFDVEIDEE